MFNIDISGTFSAYGVFFCYNETNESSVFACLLVCVFVAIIKSRKNYDAVNLFILRLLCNNRYLITVSMQYYYCCLATNFVYRVFDNNSLESMQFSTALVFYN